MSLVLRSTDLINFLALLTCLNVRVYGIVFLLGNRISRVDFVVALAAMGTSSETALHLLVNLRISRVRTSCEPGSFQLPSVLAMAWLASGALPVASASLGLPGIWLLTTFRLPLGRTQYILSPFGALIGPTGCSGHDRGCS